MATKAVEQSEGVSYAIAKKTVIALIKAGIVPYLKGPPGCGKTAMMFEIQAEKELALEDIRVIKPSFHDSVDFTGVPVVVGEGEERGTYFAPNYSLFPGPNDPKTGLLVIDEAADASVPVKNVMCAIVEEKRAASYRLPLGWAVAMTGNRVSDRSGATKEITKLISRVGVVNLEYTVKDFTAWAVNHDIHEDMVAYANFAPQHLMTFDPSNSDAPYACPRTWAKASRVYTATPNVDDTATLTALGGLISSGVTASFRTFVKLLADMPSPKDCIAHPDKAPVPNKPEVRWALCAAFIKHATKGNLSSIRTYVERFPEVELQMFLLRSLVDARASQIIGTDFAKWTTDRKDLL